MRIVLNWLLITILLAVALFIPAVIASYAYVRLHRDPGWGLRPEIFPIAVMSQHRVHVVYKNDLASFIAAAPDYSFIIPKNERAAVQEQIDALRAEEGGVPGKFEMIFLAVADRPDGSQRIHFMAAQHSDGQNESWYIAHPKSIEPQYHRFMVDLGVGIAAVFMTPAIIGVTAPLLATAIVVRRRFRKPSTPSRSAIRKMIIAALAYTSLVALMYVHSDETFWHDAREVSAAAVLLIGVAAMLWWPGTKLRHRIAIGLVAAIVSAALLLGHEALLAGFALLLLIAVGAAIVANKIYEVCVTLPGP